MKKNIIGILLLIYVKTTFGQIIVNQELQQLIQHSFTYFPQVKETENTLFTAQQNILLAKTNLPNFSGDAMYAYVRPKIVLPFPTGPNGELENFQFAPVHNGNINVNGQYELWSFGRIQANVTRAKTELQLSKDNIEMVKENLALQVATIYYNIIFYQKAIIIQDSVIEYLNENKRIVESKLRNGEALKIDLLNIQAELDAAQNTKLDFQNLFQKQINLLSYTTGLTSITQQNFDFNFPFIHNIDSAVNEAKLHNSEFAIARDKIRRAEAEIDFIKTMNRPSLGMQAEAGYKNGYVPDVTSLKWNYNAGVGLHIPIYDGSKTRRLIKLNETLVRQEQLAAASLDSTIRKDIIQALTDIKSNIERIAHTTGQIEQAKAAEKLATSRFLNGVGTNLEITNASTNVQRAEFSKLQYEYQLCLARLQLTKLLGYKYW